MNVHWPRYQEKQTKLHSISPLILFILNTTLLKSWGQWLQRLSQVCSKFKEQWTSNYIHMKKRAEGFVNILKCLLLFFFLLAVYFPSIKYWAPWDKQSAYFNAWKSHSTLCRLREINTKAHSGKMSPAIAFCLPVFAARGMCVLYFHFLHLLIQMLENSNIYMSTPRTKHAIKSVSSFSSIMATVR